MANPEDANSEVVSGSAGNAAQAATTENSSNEGNGAKPPGASARMAGMGMGGGMGGGGGMSIKDLRTFTSLKNSVFRLYYFAMLGQMGAMNMQMMARSFLVYYLTGSYVALGVMALANSVPMLLFSLFGGVIADRIEKKTVLLWGQVASAVVSLVIAILLAMDLMTPDIPNSWWILIGASLVQGVIMGLMMPARQAIIPEIVGEEHLMNALSLNTMGMNSLRLFAPAIAGFMIAGFGYEMVYYTMTALYVVAVIFIALMPKTGTMKLESRGAIGDVVQGLQYVRNQRIILMILALTLVMVLLSMPYMFLMPIFAIDILNVGESGGGLLMSISGIGAIAGSLVLASLPNKKRGLLFLCSGIVLGIALTGFSFSSLWWSSVAMIIFVGVGQTGRMTLANTLLQYYVKDEYRGRVMSLYMMEFGLTSFGVFFTTLIAEQVGVQMAVGSLAIALVICSILFLVFVPSIRKLD
jgi:MFS family permease